MNATLAQKALEKVLNPNVLVHTVAQRVRQSKLRRGGRSRPLVADIGNLGAADIALHEIIEGKMGFDMPDVVELTRPTGKKGKRPQNWAKYQAAA